MENQVELDGIVYRRMNDDWYDTSTYIRAPMVLARKLDLLSQRAVEAVAPPKEEAPPPAEPAASAADAGSDAPTFHQADAFPIIAAIIREGAEAEEDYVGHRDIVAAFLEHPEGQEMAAAAAAEQERPVKRVASNIVAWFSKRYTEEDTPYQDEFERARVRGAWAYRVAPASADG
jgi:hypothetical protein